MDRCTIFLAAMLVTISLPVTQAADDLAVLSDEFENASTISDWQRIHLVEGWNADQLRVWDIDATQPGRMVLEPYTSSWYENYRGALVFKEVTGDFVISAEVHVDDRDPGDGNMIPASDYSLGGLMIRTPRAITNPATQWTPGGENYVFLSLGNGNAVGASFQFEVKTTINSVSTLILEDTNSPTATIQIARIGGDVIALYRLPNGPWIVHRRYDRDDLPATLQAGPVSYTDYAGTVFYSGGDPYTQNSTVITDAGSNPDIVAGYEYVRFARPQVPAELVGQDLGPNNTTNAPDSLLLTFLGDAPLTPAPVSAVENWSIWNKVGD